MDSSKVLQKKLNGLWTTQDLTEKFHVTAATIQNWRKHRKLPALDAKGKGRSAIRYVPHEIRKWATTNNIPLIEV